MQELYYCVLNENKLLFYQQLLIIFLFYINKAQMSIIIWDTSHTTYPKFIYNLTITSKGGSYENKEAVAQRIINLCEERNIAINALGNLSGINPSTIYSMLNTKSQNPGVVSLQKICDGLEISIRDFFNDDLFDNIEQEII